jgi:hypothetical protein
MLAVPELALRQDALEKPRARSSRLAVRTRTMCVAVDGDSRPTTALGPALRKRWSQSPLVSNPEARKSEIRPSRAVARDGGCFTKVTDRKLFVIERQERGFASRQINRADLAEALRSSPDASFPAARQPVVAWHQSRWFVKQPRRPAAARCHALAHPGPAEVSRWLDAVSADDVHLRCHTRRRRGSVRVPHPIRLLK